MFICISQEVSIEESSTSRRHPRGGGPGVQVGGEKSSQRDSVCDYERQDPEQSLHPDNDPPGYRQHHQHGRPAGHPDHQGSVQETHRTFCRIHLSVWIYAAVLILYWLGHNRG